jgi:hypothetical protein
LGEQLLIEEHLSDITQSAIPLRIAIWQRSSPPGLAQPSATPELAPTTAGPGVFVSKHFCVDL